MTSYYDLLGVPADAGVEEVRRAYYRKAQSLHPDRLGTAPEAERRRAETEMQIVNEAWNTLRNPDARRRYDAELGLVVGPGEEGEIGDGFWDDVVEPPLRPSVLRRRGVRLAVVLVLVAGIVLSAVAFLAPAGNNRGHWSTAAVDDLRSAAIDAGMTTAQADCFVDTITSRYGPSDEVEQTVVSQMVDTCRGR